MAQYSSMTKQEIEAIAANFPIGNISSFSVLSGGWENTNYFLAAEGGSYVLTICEQKTEEEARQLAYLLEHLEKHGFETSKLIRNNRKDVLSLWKGKPILIKEFVDGKVLEDLPHQLMEMAGRELGKLHRIEAPEYLPLQLNYGKEQFADVQVYAANSSFDIWLKGKLEYISPLFAANLPKAFIHSDVFNDNIIISEDEDSAIIVDFEDAAYYYRIFDIGMMIIGTCAEGEIVNFEKVRSLLKGYSQEIQLEHIEVSALQTFTVYAGTAMTFWRHRNFNYTRPDTTLSDHYLALKVLTDFVQRQETDCFLKLVKPKL